MVLEALGEPMLDADGIIINRWYTEGTEIHFLDRETPEKYASDSTGQLPIEKKQSAL